MAKQINVDLRVNADIKQAKANFESLQKTLFKLQESTRIDVKDESLSKAQRAAGDLARNLQQATNVNTGKLDLSRFSSSLNKSGQDLKKLHQQLSSLGPEGEQAFFKLTQSIATADASTLNLGKKLSSLGVVLKNTARWQLSSSLLHGFMGAISGAYRYAQDLNESLNNIRIVTGQNIDQMSKFAKEANNAAKALSTTTTQYTDASLIYYQQGLSDEDVKRRTDATIKLANVSRQSAEEVSSQMTAIWNNFAKGNENLEYYEDVITKLGATTASSSSEIANGLSKFAAVADTVGLSYEKASAALATVVAETRQSEDIVGTAFKTMFARLEGLNLGETLEDGVDLNKYSKALDAVGVNILDNNGKIKTMNDILDETGAKWQNIGKEQQIALAQTVAGVRQYTQFIALMDNYDKVLKNEAVAKGSAGTVNEQAETYAESWEAAQKRVTAALETIYKQLLNDNFFIDMLNGAEKFLGIISNVIDGLGGVKGILLLIGSIFMQYYAKEMPRVLQSLRDNISVITGASKRRAQALLAEAREELELNAAMESRNKQMAAVATTASVTAKMTEALNKARKGLSQTEIEAYEYEIKLAGAIGKTTEELGKEIDLLEKKGRTKANGMARELSRREGPASEDARTVALNNMKEEMDSVDVDQLKNRRQQLEEEQNKIQDEITTHENNIKKLKKKKKTKNNKNNINNEQTMIDDKQESLKETEEELNNIDKLLGGNEAKTKQHHEELKKYYDTFNQYLNKTGKELFTDLEKAEKRYGKNSVIIEEAQNKIDGLNKKLAKNDLSGATKEAQKYVDKLKTIELPDNISDKLKKELIDGLNDGLEELKSGKGTDKLKAAFENFNQVLESSDMEIEAIKQHLEILGASDEDLKELSRIWEEAGKGSEEFKAKVEEIKNKIEELPQHTVKISEGLTQMASAAMQVSMVINNFQNIGRIFSDEDLSTGEKIIQIMTAFGSMLPMIIALTNKQRIVEMGAVAAKILHIGATNADTAAETASIGAKIASGTAGWYALGPLLLFVAIAAAVVAAIVLITNALMAAANAESEEEKAARLANEELERSKKAAEEAKQAYEDLKSAVSNYDSAVEVLEKCTKGTQEWRDAFKEVLEQASNLLTLYPDLLTEKNLFLSDGTLNPDILHSAEERAKNISTNATNNQMLRQVDLAEANVKMNISNFISSKLNSKAKELSGLDLDQTVFFKENGDNVSAKTLMKDFVAKITTSNAFEDLTLNPEDQNKIVQLTKDFLNKSGIKEGQEGENLNFTNATSLFSEVLQDSIPDIQKLSQETENLATQMQNASNIIFKNYFTDKKFTDTNEEIAYQKAFNEQNKKIDDEIEKAQRYADTLKDFHSAFWSEQKINAEFKLIEGKNNGDLAAYNNLIKIYSDQNPNSKYTGVTVEDGNLLVKEEGVKKENWKPIQEVLAEIKPVLQEKARQDIEEKGSSIYNSMDKTRIDAAAYLQVKGNLDEVSYEEVQDSLFKNGKMDFSNIDKKAMADTLHIAEDEVEGYLTKTIKTYTSELNKIPDYLNEHLNTDLINKINLGSLEEVGRLYTNILANSGKAGVQILDDIVKESGEKAPQILEVLANTDFSSQTVDQINASFKDLGINFQLTEGQIYSLRQALVSNFNMSLETAQETAKSISSIISKLKNQGDIIEEEDYQKLLNINPALSTFFTTLADGTHMLTGEIQDFKKATQSSTIGQLYTVKQNQQETVSAYNSLSSGVVSSDKLGGFDELYLENKGRFGAWEKYENQTRAQIKILQDNNQEIATELLAQIEEGKNLDDVTYQTAKAYEKLNLSSKEFSEKAEEAAKKVQEITEAIKETQYQFDIQNAGLEYETTENYANVLMELYEAEGLSKDAARALSIANQRLDRGLSSLNDNFETISKSLKNANKASAEYAETIGSLRKTFADLLNIADGEELSTKWIEKWANDADKMKKILDGDTEAIQEFRESAFSEMTDNVFKEVNESAKNLFDGMTEADGKDVYDALQKLINQLDNGKISAEGLKQELDNIGSTEIGSKAVLSKEYTEALNTMLAQGLLTEQQLNDIFATIGYKPKVTVKDIKQEVNVPIYRTYTQYDKAKTAEKGTATGWDNESIQADTSKVTWTEQIGTKKMVQTVPAVQIVSDEAAGGGGEIEVVNAGSMNITPSYNSTTSGKSSDSSKSNSSSSSSNPTTKATSHDHEVNRYSNEENAIKGLSEQYDRLNKVKDKAFGKSRIQAIEAEIKHLKALKEASGDYLDAIVGKGNADKMAKAIFKGKNIGQMIANGSLGGTARADYNSLFSGLSASGKGVEYSAKDANGNEWLVSDNYSLSGFNSLFGTNLQFNLDSYGNIQNKDAIYNLLQNLKNNENDAYSRVADPTAGSTTEYNKRMAYLEAIKERVDQFEETVDLMGEKADEYIDYIASIQEKNAELITTKMEHGVNLGQKTIQRLERAIKILGDNIYKTAEAMTTWYNATLKEGVEANKQQGEAYAQAFVETAEKIRLYDQKDGYFNENAIDPASAVELLSSIEDGYDSLIDDLLNRIEEGKAYYENVLDYWNNKLDKVNSAIQTNAQLLEHFQTVLNLLGRTADYEAIGTVLQGQLENAQSDYTSKKAQADVAKQAYERAIQGRESLIAQGVSAEALEQYEEDVLHKALENYQAKADAMYSALEHYIETANAKFENEINRAFAESEDRLTGEWGSFDALDSAMQRQRSVSDEYLTKTNQLYESNTLLRKLSQDIDKTDSRIAKGKLKAFADEIEAMKAQEKLSKTDLEIAKARYELLQAEIALEDARNAKSTVRLKRDSEGNYGYVYTADQDAVNDAEQNLAEKQNNLYNLVLSQTQEYGEKMIQLRKEHDAEIHALEEAYYKEGIISREEFEMQLQDIEKKYQELEYAEMQSYETAKLWLNRTGAEGQTEAWTNSFDEIITQHRLFNDESENNMTELSNNVISNLDELDSQREYFTKEAKMGNEELKRSVNEITRSTDELSKKVAGKNGLADSMNTAMITAQNLATAFSSQYDTLRSLITQYGRAADEANALYKKTVNLINAQIALNHAQAGATEVSWNTDGTGGASAYYGNGNGNTGSSGNNTNNDLSIKNGNGNTRGNDNKQRYAVHDYITGKDIIVTEDQIEQYRLKGAGPSRYLIKKISSYGTPGHFKSGGYTGIWASGKTGMYTGAWNGPDIEENGKLAFLHQKELVLNADDTENMLSAVKLIRQISQTIDLQAISQAAGLQMAPMKYNIDGQTLQQDITIHAEFPNVSDHNEIEEALSNLVNRATQFAHRS